jgi:hypothetical protein
VGEEAQEEEGSERRTLCGRRHTHHFFAARWDVGDYNDTCVAIAAHSASFLAQSRSLSKVKN